jgi:hypothetical protein
MQMQQVRTISSYQDNIIERWQQACGRAHDCAECRYNVPGGCQDTADKLLRKVKLVTKNSVRPGREC